MLINCDIGERGVSHNIDDQLMSYIDIANIACGGHAGNQQSVEYYYSLAIKLGVKPSVHLSYPDKQNFGRVIMDIDSKMLLNSLDQQYKLLSEVTTLKFHGALYNETNINKELAQLLINWAKNAGIKEILCPEHSEISTCAKDQIEVIYEAFLDRQYIFKDNHLLLKSRKHPNALLTNTDDVIKQYKNFLNHFLVIDHKKYKIKVDTGCIHSDSENALELIRAIQHV